MSEPDGGTGLPPGMEARGPVFYFDYVDPGSYLLTALLPDVDFIWRGFEIRPPPEPPLDPRESTWAAYQEDAVEFARAMDVPMVTPRWVPWTRKAHELTEHARAQDCSKALRDALFRAHFVEGLDIGRIDVLVALARSVGLEGSGEKASLDVDHWTDQVASNRALALETGIVGVPTIAVGGDRLEGLRSIHEIRRWLAERDQETT